MIKDNNKYILEHIAPLILGLGFLLATASASAVTVTHLETFDNFSCSGPTLPNPFLVNTVSGNSFKASSRACSDGWTIETHRFSSNQSTAQLDPVFTYTPVAVRNASAVAGAPAPGVETIGVRRIYKTFNVKAGAPITSISWDHSYDGPLTVIPKIFDGRLSAVGSGLELPSLAGFGIGTGLVATYRVGRCPSDPFPLAENSYANFCLPMTQYIYPLNIGTPSSSQITFSIEVGYSFGLGSRGTFSERFQRLRLDNVKIVQEIPDNSLALADGELDEAWVNSFTSNNSQLENAEGIDIKTDANGNVYSLNNNTYAAIADITTVKYNSVGTQLWATTYDSGGVDQAVALDVDSNGNVYVLTKVKNALNFDFATIKYNSAGVQQWVTPYDNNGDDIPVAIQVDSAGNPIVIGTSANGADNDTVTIQYNTATGAQQWLQRYQAGTVETAVGLHIDGSDNSYVLASTKSGSSRDVAIIKYNSLGVQQWVYSFGSQSSGFSNNDYAVDLAGDATGNTTALIRLVIRGGRDKLAILKLDATGKRLWSKKYPAPGSSITADVIPVALALDSAGDAIAVAKQGTPGDYNWLTVKFANGAQQWAVEHGQANVNEEPVDIQTDASNRVYVTGLTHSTTDNITTLTYDAAGTLVSTLTASSGLGDDKVAALALGTDAFASATTAHIAGTVYSGISTTASTVKYSAMYRDLTVNSVSVQASVFNDQTISLPNEIENIYSPATGRNRAALNFDVAYSLAPSIGGTPDLNALIPLGTRTVASLLAGGKDNTSISVTIPGPATVVPGNYFVVAQVDSGAAVTEIDESNNLRVSSTTVAITDAPDLLVSAVTTSTSINSGQPVAINYTVDNTRAPTAGAFNVNFILSSNTILGDADDVLLGNTAIANQAGNSSIARNISLVIPNTTVAGNYFIGVIVDTAGAVAEVVETNNSLVSPAFTVTPSPDLVISFTNPPFGAERGTNIVLDNTATNTVLASTAIAGSFNVGFYLSQDQTITTADVFIGSRSVLGGLAPGSFSTASTTLTIPASIAPGVWNLGAIVDYTNTVIESDETNNTVSSNFSIANQPVVAGNGSDGSATIAGTINLLVNSVGASTDANGTQPDGFATRLPGGNNWDSGAASSQVITADGSVQFTPVSTNISRMFGLSNTNANAHFNTIDYALYALTAGRIFVYENGGYKGSFGNYAAGDILSVERIGTTVVYKKNGVVVYTSLTPSTGNLIADTSIYSVNGTVSNALINGQPITWVDAVNVAVNGNSLSKLPGGATAGATALQVASTAGFVTGDEIMIVQMAHPTNHGVYEFVQNITVIDGNNLSLPTALTHSYFTSGSTYTQTQVLRVPQYTDLTIPAGTILTTSAYNRGTGTGGIVAFRTSGTLTVDGTIDAFSKGFAGGATHKQQGYSYTGATPISNTTANFGGGGGGNSASTNGATNNAGASGGYGTAGTNGFDRGAGQPYGDANLARIYLGSGGGAGGRRNGNGIFTAGGRGGGIVYLTAGSVAGNGNVTVKGRNGVSGSSGQGGPGGGGSGGSLFVKAAGFTPSFDISGGVNEFGLIPGGLGRTKQDVAPLFPDLIVTDVTGPANATRGDTVPVSTSVQNIFTPDITTPFIVGIYLSTDTTITTADIKIGERTINSLAGNTVDTATTNVTIPLDLFVGGTPQTYYLGAIADSGSQLNITWASAVGVTVTGNSLTKLPPVAIAAWDTGASSSQVLTGDGTVQFTVGETNSFIKFGLSDVDTGPDFNSIDYGIYLQGGTNWAVFHGGSSVQTGLGSYVIGDVFTVRRSGTFMQYLKNGSQFKSVNVGTTGNLIVDTSINTPGGSINNAKINGVPVIWVNKVGGTVTGNTHVKDVGPDAWDAGAASTQIITGNGSVEFTATETNTNRMLGLSNLNTNANFNTINYAIYATSSGVVRVYESGTHRGAFGSYVSGDILKVERSGTTVLYKKNDTVIYTSLVASTGDLIADTSLHTTAATINNALLTPSGVTEVNETNNAAIQTGVGGAPLQSVIAVNINAAAVGGGSSGGGILSLFELMLALFLLSLKFLLRAPLFYHPVRLIR